MLVAERRNTALKRNHKQELQVEHRHRYGEKESNRAANQSRATARNQEPQVVVVGAQQQPGREQEEEGG
jgi:hypothetical protein